MYAVTNKKNNKEILPDKIIIALKTNVSCYIFDKTKKEKMFDFSLMNNLCVFKKILSLSRRKKLTYSILASDI